MWIYLMRELSNCQVENDIWIQNELAATKATWPMSGLEYNQEETNVSFSVIKGKINESQLGLKTQKEICRD